MIARAVNALKISAVRHQKLFQVIFLANLCYPAWDRIRVAARQI